MILLDMYSMLLARTDLARRYAAKGCERARIRYLEGTGCLNYSPPDRFEIVLGRWDTANSWNLGGL